MLLELISTRKLTFVHIFFIDFRAKLIIDENFQTAAVQRIKSTSIN